MSPLTAVVEPLEPAPAVPASYENRARNIALFLAAPFVGLAYFMFLPIVGTAMLLQVATRHAHSATNQGS